jgi:hypothetical protein
VGRPAEGWKLRLRHGIWCVRFTAHGKQVDRSTGRREHEREAAAAAAPGIYAKEIRTPKQSARKVGARSGGLLEEARRWLKDEETLRDEETTATYALYARSHWAPHFSSVAAVTTARIERYRSERLRKVSAETVRKELGALRAFLRWLGSELTVPGVPRRATGTRVASHWTERVISLLESPAKERYRVAFETSLRPATLDSLSVPEHWRPGSRYLTIPDELDKAREGREVPLSLRAVRALLKTAPESGLIFGPKRYRKQLKKAAKLAIPGERGERFAPTDFRAARVTLWLEESGNLPGVMFLAGHRQATTTARYVRTSLRAAEAVLGIKRKAR